MLHFIIMVYLLLLDKWKLEVKNLNELNVMLAPHIFGTTSYNQT